MEERLLRQIEEDIKDPAQKRRDILDLAKGIITHDRNKTYGEPEDVFNLISVLWSIYLREITGEEDVYVDPEHVAVMMALMKIARITANPSHRDSWVDAIGYLAIGASMGEFDK